MGQKLENHCLTFLICLFMNEKIVSRCITDDTENLTRTIFWGRQCPLDTGMKFYFYIM